MSAKMRSALLKKPLLSLFAYEVSCRVRVEKTTRALAVELSLPGENVHPKIFWFPRSWAGFGFMYQPIYIIRQKVVVFQSIFSNLFQVSVNFQIMAGYKARLPCDSLIDT